MRFYISSRGKLVEQHQLIIVEYKTGVVVGFKYFKEGETSVPLEADQVCYWLDEENK